MARSPSRSPTEGELEILNVLWEHGPSELGGVRSGLRKGREVAATTVATMLKVMEGKGLVERSVGEGKRTIWSARVSRSAARTTLLQRLLETAFGGSASSLVSHMIEDNALSPEDRAAIRSLLDSKGSRRSKQSRKEDQT